MDSQLGAAAFEELRISRSDEFSLDHFAEMLAEGELARYRFLRPLLVDWEFSAHRFS
jgi:hypothetical protein